MKKLFFLSFLILFLETPKLLAQAFNCTGLSASRYYLKDTIMVNCDTVFLLNKMTYSFYKNQLKKINAADPKLKELVTSQGELINLYEKRILDMGNQYAELRKTFDENLKKSAVFIEGSNREMTSINSSLTKAQGNIAAAQDSISSVKSILIKDMAKIKKNNLKWGIGGVVFGVLATMVLKGQ
ncbi:MAG: hypothetical protein HY015_08330 [Bacteroidetes bacterium]|nr:hypothetical protein [Bacteroidota bacterium]MBI3482963.1 hypothetical protein [Bacteroidota bacterium]